MESLARLLLFRQMTDKLTSTEFNQFQQTFCEHIDRLSFLQIVFDGLNKTGNSLKIDNTIQIVQSIIDSREPINPQDKNATPPRYPITICSLPSSVIQFIGTHLSLQNVLNFEKTNRFIARSLLTPSSVKYITEIDNNWINKWLQHRAPCELLHKHSSDDFWYFDSDKNYEYSMKNDLKRLTQITKLCFNLRQNDTSSFFGRIMQRILQEDYPYEPLDTYISDTVCDILKIFTSLKYLDFSFDIECPLVDSSITIINDNSSTLETLILRNYHPMQMMDLFKYFEGQLTNLKHFALIDINTDYSYNKEGIYSKEDEWKDRIKYNEYGDPFMPVNEFFRHFLPNVCLSDYKMYPPFETIVIDDDYNATEEQYIENIAIEKVEVKGYEYLTIDNCDLVFDEYTNSMFNSDAELSQKIVELFTNSEMIRKSFDQLKGICALNLTDEQNTYHLITSILNIYSNNIQSLHIHNVSNMNQFNKMNFKNLNELCSDINLSKNIKAFENCTRLQRLHFKILDATERKPLLTKYGCNLLKIFNSNYLLEYLSIDVCVKKNENELDNVLKMLQNVFKNVKHKTRKQLKLRINVVFRAGIKTRVKGIVILNDNEIQKLLRIVEESSNNNAMLLFNIKVNRNGIMALSSITTENVHKLKINDNVLFFNNDEKFVEGILKEKNDTNLKLQMSSTNDKFEWIDGKTIRLWKKIEYINRTHEVIWDGNTWGDRTISYSFALSSTNCAINGFAEHWKLDCKICDAKQLLTFKVEPKS